MNPSGLYTDTPNAIGNSLLVDPLVTLNATSGDNYINITESNARSAVLSCPADKKGGTLQEYQQSLHSWANFEVPADKCRRTAQEHEQCLSGCIHAPKLRGSQKILEPQGKAMI